MSSDFLATRLRSRRPSCTAGTATGTSDLAGGTKPLRTFPVSSREDRMKRTIATLIAASVVVAIASLFVGSRSIPAAEVLEALRGTSKQELGSIIWDLRVPRTLLAFAVGSSLAVAGVLAQAWTRNPLADPGFIGITSGASFAVAFGSVVGVVTNVGSAASCALVGAALAAGLVMFIARRAPDPITLLLVGVGVDATLRSGTVLIGLFDTDVLDSMRHWVVGSTFGRGFSEIVLAWTGLVVGFVLALIAARPLDLLAFGDDASQALGGSPRLARLLSALGVVLLAGSATAAAGPVVFVGFAAPHVMRVVLGPQVTRLILPAALTGGIMVLAADIVGRLVLRPGELEMSIVIAILGAPLMIAVVRRRSSWQKVGSMQ